MILVMLKILFSKLVGDIPKEKRDDLWDKFTDLLKEVAEAAAKGAAEGARK